MVLLTCYFAVYKESSFALSVLLLKCDGMHSKPVNLDTWLERKVLY